MMKSVYVKSRLEPELKRDAEKVMKKMGFKPSSVIQLLYHQIAETKTIPLGVIFNQETEEAIKDLATSKNLKGYSDVDELMKDLAE